MNLNNVALKLEIPLKADKKATRLETFKIVWYWHHLNLLNYLRAFMRSVSRYLSQTLYK